MTKEVKALKADRRFCFIISPIGEPASIERQQADEFLALVKEVGELHGLEVKRADEFVGTSDINADVIERVQQSDLCIIDLTGLNPNVMYEFGMRYQTGLPYIVCAKESTSLPFDTISRRTIFYGNINNTHEARRVKEQIRSFVRVFEDKEYQNSEIITISDLYKMLQTVLEKLDSQDNPQYSANSNTANNITEDVDELLRQLDPSEAFHYAYSTNNIKLADNLLEYCRNQPFEFFFNKLCALATLGSEKAATELEQYLLDSIESTSFDNALEAIGALVTCYNRQDSELLHIESMEVFFEKALIKAQSNKERAAILNQKQRLYAGANEYATARTIAEKVIELNDEEPAYFFNYATVLKHLDDLALALKFAKKAVDISEEDDDNHLAFACELLKSSKDPVDLEIAKDYMKRLEKISPLKARLLRLK